VALLTENPPHSQFTISCPKYGMVETRLVITVAPQNDICPQGSTYPKKAVAIKINKIIVPLIQTVLALNDE
jgi:hypothetical protein